MRVGQTNIEAIEMLGVDLGVDVGGFSIDEDVLDEMYRGMLNSCHECKCETCCVDYSEALKKQDPTMYRCGFSDWLDSEISNNALFYVDTEYLDEEGMIELQEALKEAIDELF